MDESGEYLPPFLRRQMSWDDRWRRPEFDPPWKSEILDPAIREAIDDGWFHGRNLLDVGCGDGAVTVQLVSRGSRVTGIDFSPHAIARARKRWSQVEGVDFQVRDAIFPWVPPQAFDAILDRGCVQEFDAEMREAYLRNLHAWTAPGCRLLLLMRCPPVEAQAKTLEIRQLFAGRFAVTDARSTFMGDQAPDKRIPGLVFRLLRAEP
ncbi:MAG TPA: methyltransferase domain-containing protein [Planctomycetota bacterium]|nr:methyltransferase domain-containing protein [Planctomycetota bacterium]